MVQNIFEIISGQEKISRSPTIVAQLRICSSFYDSYEKIELGFKETRKNTEMRWWLDEPKGMNRNINHVGNRITRVCLQWSTNYYYTGITIIVSYERTSDLCKRSIRSR